MPFRAFGGRKTMVDAWLGAIGLCGFAACALLSDIDNASSAEWATCKYFSQLPDDCAGARLLKYENLRNYRYEEVDLFAKDVLKKILYESSYNTTGLNGGDDSRDSAPQSLTRDLDPKAIAKQYQALIVRVSPPRYWTIDWLADRFGSARNFGGLNAAWMGNGLAPADSSKPGVKTYRYVPISRTAAEGFNKGTKVYLLDDPMGRTWVMKSYTDKVDSGLSIDSLETLGSLITMPSGWKFRVVVLDKELVLVAKSGSAAYIQDDKENIYDLTGPNQSNFNP
jgi:hypothetical protein